MRYLPLNLEEGGKRKTGILRQCLGFKAARIFTHLQRSPLDRSLLRSTTLPFASKMEGFFFIKFGFILPAARYIPRQEFLPLVSRWNSYLTDKL